MAAMLLEKTNSCSFLCFSHFKYTDGFAAFLLNPCPSVFLILSILKSIGEPMDKLFIRPLSTEDRDWVAHRVIDSWEAEIVVVHDTIYHPAELPGFVALAGEKPVGLLTYHNEGTACEIVTLDSWRENRGVGTRLIESVIQAARREGCKRLWLVTTNDNTHALRFYQKRGFTLAAIHINAIEKARTIKPEIPHSGINGIPIRDELELEMWI
jgi:ribosomal protein S18 acetylase RimI-like enzyme